MCRGITIEHVNMKIRNRKTFYLILFVLYSWKFYQHHIVWKVSEYGVFLSSVLYPILTEYGDLSCTMRARKKFHIRKFFTQCQLSLSRRRSVSYRKQSSYYMIGTSVMKDLNIIWKFTNRTYWETFRTLYMIDVSRESIDNKGNPS